MSLPNNLFQNCRSEILYEVTSHGFAPLKPNSITPIDFRSQLYFLTTLSSSKYNLTRMPPIISYSPNFQQIASDNRMLGDSAMLKDILVLARTFLVEYEYFFGFLESSG